MPPLERLPRAMPPQLPRAMPPRAMPAQLPRAMPPQASLPQPMLLQRILQLSPAPGKSGPVASPQLSSSAPWLNRKNLSGGRGNHKHFAKCNGE